MNDWWPPPAALTAWIRANKDFRMSSKSSPSPDIVSSSMVSSKHRPNIISVLPAGLVKPSLNTPIRMAPRFSVVSSEFPHHWVLSKRSITEYVSIC